MKRRSYRRYLLGTVAGLFLFLQLGLISRNGCTIGKVDRPAANSSSGDGVRTDMSKVDRPAANSSSGDGVRTDMKEQTDLLRNRLALEKELARQTEELAQSRRQQYIDRMAESDVDRAGARIYGLPRESAGFMTVGIPSIRRENVTYLEDTIASLSKSASEDERKEIVVVVFLSDFDEISRNASAKHLGRLFTKEILEGFLHVIKAPGSFYPDFNNLERTFNDPIKRVKWRSKQNLDYAYLMKYSQPLSTYYMQLEDDVVTVNRYLARIKEYIERMGEKHWSCLEFSRLGFIGKLFPSADIGRLAKFLITFFDQQPVDLLFPYFYRLMTQGKPLMYKYSLFQHMGQHSSLNNDNNPLKDNTFIVEVKKYKGDNPPAEVYSNMEVFEDCDADRAYAVDERESFFWGKAPKSGDYLTVVFKEPQRLKRLILITGTTHHPGDILGDGLVQVGSTVKKTEGKRDTCEQFKDVGHFEKGVADIKFSSDFVPYNVSCIRMTIKGDQRTWLIVSEIAVFTKH